MVRNWNELPLLLTRKHMRSLFHDCSEKTLTRGIKSKTMLTPLDPDAKRQFWRREEVKEWVDAGCPPMSTWLKRRSPASNGDGGRAKAG